MNKIHPGLVVASNAAIAEAKKVIREFRRNNPDLLVFNGEYLDFPQIKIPIQVAYTKAAEKQGIDVNDVDFQLGMAYEVPGAALTGAHSS